MYATSAWQPPSARRTEPRTVRFDLRDRVKDYTVDSGIANSPIFDNLSPTDAFFGAPSSFPIQRAARQPSVRRAQKNRQVHREDEKQQVQQEQQRLSLSDLQATQSPLAKELIDRVVSKSDSIYGDTLTRLSDLHKELASIIAETNAEDDRILKLLETNHKKTIKPPSDSRMSDERTAGGEIQVGERVALVKDRIDTVEADVASLWDQWENAQKEVNDIFSEFASTRGVMGLQTGSVAGVQESLAGEMAKFGEELTGLLEDAHEEARTSEKSFSKKINGLMSALLQQYLLED